MKLTSLICAAMAFLAFAIIAVAPANAACPAGTRYDCVTTITGKQSCGCR